MDLLLTSVPPQFASDSLPHIIPYLIITFNFILFKLLRSFLNKAVAYYAINTFAAQTRSRSQALTGKSRLAKLFIDELISTCELCAACAELNVVYERHGSLAYGAALFVLSYLWIDAFGEAHTTPGYLVEDYFFIKGNQLLKTGDAYARFVGQSIAMPLAWRLASFYWKYKLLTEHREYLITENCKSSLTTSTINGFLIELGCCLVCRLIELVGHKLLEHNRLSQRAVSLATSFGGTFLVVIALELSGGYFNPVLAASLEYGCRGINVYQHAVVFWLGPLLGHILARGLFRRFGEQMPAISARTDKRQTSSGKKSNEPNGSAKRLTRSTSQRHKKKHND